MGSDIRRLVSGSRTRLVSASSSSKAPLTGVHWQVPQPVAITRGSGPEHFSELRARTLLKKLSEVGPKPSGSDGCDEQTFREILEELTTIQISISADSHHSMEIDVQRPSGCFSIQRPLDKEPFGSCYRNVTNIAVRLSAKNRPVKSALLLNCHYDSWPTGPGTT